MQTCPKCKGTKKLDIKVTTYGKPGEEIKSINCIYCNASGKLTDSEIAKLKAEEEAWCRCGNPSRQTQFWDDGQNPVCSKHCWTCRDCGKILQVG
jgi:hypothetical protein